jgi:hypothetical protein
LKDKVKPCKGSVRFETTAEDPIVSNIYVSRKAAKKLLGVKGDLENIAGIEVTLRVVPGKAKREEDDEE